MSKHTYFGKSPERSLAPTGKIYRYYIPDIDVYVRVCGLCRLKHWESILLKKWKLVGSEGEEENPCMACSEEEPLDQGSCS